MTREEFIKTIINKLRKTYEILLNEEKLFKKSKFMRFYLYKDFLAIYSEIISHKEMKTAISESETNTYFKIDPLIYETFSFIRNLLFHFPIFSYWDEVVFNKELINWNSNGKSIDKYLTTNKRIIGWEIKHYGTGQVCRAVIDNFTTNYESNEQIPLKKIIDEKSAIRLFRSIISEIIYIIDVRHAVQKKIDSI